MEIQPLTTLAVRQGYTSLLKTLVEKNTTAVLFQEHEVSDDHIYPQQRQSFPNLYLNGR